MTVLLLVLVSLPEHVVASGLPEKSLTEIMELTDHVLIGKIVKVDMLDTNDAVVFDISKKTGPGSGNTIRVHVKKLAVMMSDRENIPDSITLPLWRMWDHSLGQVKDELLFETAIFLLKGDTLLPAYPGSFIRGIHEGPEIEALIKKRLKKVKGEK